MRTSRKRVLWVFGVALLAACSTELNIRDRTAVDRPGDLPDCSAKIDSKVYYIRESKKFVQCDASSLAWIEIDLATSAAETSNSEIGVYDDDGIRLGTLASGTFCTDGNGETDLCMKDEVHIAIEGGGAAIFDASDPSRIIFKDSFCGDCTTDETCSTGCGTTIEYLDHYCEGPAFVQRKPVKNALFPSGDGFVIADGNETVKIEWSEWEVLSIWETEPYSRCYHIPYFSGGGPPAEGYKVSNPFPVSHGLSHPFKGPLYLGE